MPIPESALVFLAGVKERARKLQRRIVFPEGSDARVLKAAQRLAKEGAGKPIVLGTPPAAGAEGVTFINPASAPQAGKYATLYYEKRRYKGLTQMEAADAVRDPLYFAALMVEAGDADGTVGGAVATSAVLLRADLRCLGRKPGVQRVSSAYIMALQNKEMGHNGLMAFADCAVNIEPSAVELAEIALSTADTTRNIIGAEPIVALLSFSTKGSGRHPQVDKVREALRVVRVRQPDLIIDGELQADAAVNASVAAIKCPGSRVGGRANALVFPNLASANIGYKLVERVAGAAAIGPFVQGFSKPANDLSRGCSADDIYYTALITAIQSEKR